MMTSRNTTLFVCAAFACLVGFGGVSPAWTQDPGGDELIFVPPEGWHPAHQNSTDGGYEITYVPEGETASDWTEAARAQIFYNMSETNPDLSPADFVENYRRYYEQSCQAVDASAISAWDDHGYPAAVRIILCDRQRGESIGSVSMIKVMKGRVSTFVLDRTWRGPAFDIADVPVAQETMDTWSEFLAHSFLCNRADPETPCPGSSSE